MRVVVIATTLVLGLAGCGVDDDEPTSARSPAERSSPTESAEPTSISAPIVGNWKRVTTCAQRVKALQDAGLGEFAVEHAAGEGWIPGVTRPDQIKDQERPCEGAVPLEHGHSFTEGGEFGSTDHEGDVVDDGTYRVADRNTIVIDNVTFHYRIRGDSLFLDPVLPKCSKNGCFAAQWAVAVAYPGLPWKRVDQ
jgi:hypothetical protein